MPVLFDAGAADTQQDSPDITVALVNNMSDEALKPTERQFLTLLEAASEGMRVCVTLYTLPEIARSSALGRHIGTRYGSIEDLWGGTVDGLIVTGREPLTARLEHEAYWRSFTRLLDWARQNTHASIWSCLAAHAAVLHMDGIERVKRSDKLFGIFDCRQVVRHSLTAGVPATMRLPHSRWNGIAQHELVESGYEVLSGSPEVGVDTFIKQEKSLLLFFQGHPEYLGDTLLREYRRDVARYRRGESAHTPSIPQNYFDQTTAANLATNAELEQGTIGNVWAPSATTIYRNWLKHLCARKLAAHPTLPAPLLADLEPVS